MDNVTAVTYINKMGGPHSLLLSQLAKDLWDWCLNHNVLLRAQYLPGIQNVQTDRESRVFLDSSDWKLNTTIFDHLYQKWGPLNLEPICIPPNIPTGPVCELETRPPGNTHRCFHSELGDIPGIRISPICADRSVPSTGSEPEGRPSSAGDTSLASPNLVSTLTGTLCGLPPSTANANQSVDTTGQKPPPSPATASWVASLNRGYQTHGFSDQTRKILLAAWRQNTTSSYSSAWNIWHSWCIERVTVNPLSPSLSNILDFSPLNSMQGENTER